MFLAKVVHIAERQYGVFSLNQAVDAGIARQRVSELHRRSLVERILPGVYRPLGAPLTYPGELMAACLAGGPGTAVSHSAAARLWRLGSLAPGPPEVISPRWKRLRALGIEAHESKLFDESDITDLEGFPVLTPVRTLFTLGVDHPGRVVAQCLDEALDRGLVSLPDVERELERLAKSGRNGIGAIRDALALKAYAPGVSESPLEQRFLELLRNARLPAPVRQHRVLTRHGEFRLDFAYPERKLGFEIDGRRWHDRSDAFERDRLRQNALVSEGWRIFNYTGTQMRDRPVGVQQSVAEALLATGGYTPLRTE